MGPLKFVLQNFDCSLQSVGFLLCLGFIGKLKIEIPLTRIQSQAWVLHIEDLYLVAGPSQLSEVSTLYVHACGRLPE